MCMTASLPTPPLYAAAVKELFTSEVLVAQREWKKRDYLL